MIRGSVFSFFFFILFFFPAQPSSKSDVAGQPSSPEDKASTSNLLDKASTANRRLLLRKLPQLKGSPDSIDVAGQPIPHPRDHAPTSNPSNLFGLIWGSKCRMGSDSGKTMETGSERIYLYTNDRETQPASLEVAAPTNNYLLKRATYTTHFYRSYPKPLTR